MDQHFLDIQYCNTQYHLHTLYHQLNLSSAYLKSTFGVHWKSFGYCNWLQGIIIRDKDKDKKCCPLS